MVVNWGTIRYILKIYSPKGIFGLFLKWIVRMKMICIKKPL